MSDHSTAVIPNADWPPLVIGVIILILACIAGSVFALLVACHYRRNVVHFVLLLFVPIYSVTAACCAISALLLAWNMAEGTYGSNEECGFQAFFQMTKGNAHFFGIAYVMVVTYHAVVKEELPNNYTLLVGTICTLVLSVFLALLLVVTGQFGAFGNSRCWCATNGLASDTLLAVEFAVAWIIIIVCFAAIHRKLHTPSSSPSKKSSKTKNSVTSGSGGGQHERERERDGVSSAASSTSFSAPSATASASATHGVARLQHVLPTSTNQSPGDLTVSVSANEQALVQAHLSPTTSALPTPSLTTGSPSPVPSGVDRNGVPLPLSLSPSSPSPPPGTTAIFHSSSSSFSAQSQQKHARAYSSSHVTPSSATASITIRSSAEPNPMAVIVSHAHAASIARRLTRVTRAMLVTYIFATLTFAVRFVIVFLSSSVSESEIRLAQLYLTAIFQLVHVANPIFATIFFLPSCYKDSGSEAGYEHTAQIESPTSSVKGAAGRSASKLQSRSSVSSYAEGGIPRIVPIRQPDGSLAFPYV